MRGGWGFLKTVLVWKKSDKGNFVVVTSNNIDNKKLVLMKKYLVSGLSFIPLLCSVAVAQSEKQ